MLTGLPPSTTWNLHAAFLAIPSEQPGGIRSTTESEEEETVTILVCLADKLIGLTEVFDHAVTGSGPEPPSNLREIQTTDSARLFSKAQRVAKIVGTRFLIGSDVREN